MRPSASTNRPHLGPRKTALCLLALSAVCVGTGPGCEPAYRDDPREAGGQHDPVQRKRLTDMVVEAGQWLLHNHHRWEEFVEDDKDVQGTAWEHMAYALCTQAATLVGASPRDPRLAKAWKLMNDLWDPEAGLWNEPGASGKRATIQAAYYTVSAYEEAMQRLARMNLADSTPRPRTKRRPRWSSFMSHSVQAGRSSSEHATAKEAWRACCRSACSTWKVVYDAPEAGMSPSRSRQSSTSPRPRCPSTFSASTRPCPRPSAAPRPGYSWPARATVPADIVSRADRTDAADISSALSGVSG
ncbi:hypothetical protein [Streptomyces decoyicus]|uniref:hypothetical protein n=1 Tax=Streptomyces decoyicus TaxID=249567 RepID=UPI0033AABA2A